MKKILFTLLAVVCIVSAVTAQVPLVYKVENTGANCPNPPLPTVNQLPAVPMLPDPFAWSDGSGRVKTFSEWTCRHAEIRAEIEHYEIGRKPGRPADIQATYADSILTVVVKENGKSVTLTSKVVVPSGSGPFPVVLGMNFPTGSLPADLFNDCIQIPYLHNQVAVMSMSGTKEVDSPFYQMYPELVGNGDYSAWSWGISRLIDGIEILCPELQADMSRIAITGCSYAGKMALFGSALDERIALTIVQESGGGGINAWRVSDTLGEVEKIANTNYTWFMPELRENFNGQPDKLPYDHHELMALVAPRPLLILGDPDYEWMADESGYISSMAALEVWKAMGVEDRFGFDFSPDHPHCFATESQCEAVARFLDRFFRGKKGVDTAIRFAPLFENTDYNRWIEAWKGHVLKMND